MQHRQLLCVASLLLTLVFIQTPVPSGAQSSRLKISSLTISSPDQLKDEFASVPCEDKDRLAAVKSLFEREGVPPAEIEIDKYPKAENLVVVKKGESAEKIVLGAHYDKVKNGCGAVDNWTGVVALVHLYRTLKNVPTRKTLVFIGFGNEEAGLVGSRAMTKGFSKEQAAEYCAMINIDSLGLTSPQVADNMSTRKLGEFVGQVANEMGIPFSHASVKRADSDSSAFVAKNIPAVTIHGMSSEFRKVLHTPEDQPSKVNPTSVYLGYKLALEMVMRLDESTCDAYR